MLVVVKTGATSLPTVPETVLALIGISAGSYVVGKGIQEAADTAVDKARLDKGKEPTGGQP